MSEFETLKETVLRWAVNELVPSPDIQKPAAAEFSVTCAQLDEWGGLPNKRHVQSSGTYGTLVIIGRKVAAGETLEGNYLTDWKGFWDLVQDHEDLRIRLDAYAREHALPPYTPQ